MRENGRQRIGLALGGGVVRGFAHIGVLSVLEQAKIPIDCLAGTSVGAIIGAVYATGMKLPLILQMADAMHWPHLARPTLSGDGLFSFRLLEEWLERTLGNLYFEDLRLPFAAVCTDIETGESVAVSSGPLAPAVRASCSVPGIIAPARLNGRLLCDGGISNNLPVTAVRHLGADYVIGVDIFQPNPAWRLGPLKHGLAAVEIMVEHAGGGLNTADCLISPDLSGKTYLRFGHRANLIALGQAATTTQIPTLHQALNGRLAGS